MGEFDWAPTSWRCGCQECPGCHQSWPVSVYVYPDGMCAMCNLPGILYEGNPLMSVYDEGDA